jgi:hypothetical protein
MTLLDALGLSCITGLIGWSIGASTMADHVYNAGVKEGQRHTYNAARKDLEDELRRVCKPWFTWKHQTIVACTAPDWMTK